MGDHAAASAEVVSKPPPRPPLPLPLACGGGEGLAVALLGGGWSAAGHELVIHQAARAHGINGGVQFRMLHADAQRSVAAHGVPGEAAALTSGNSPVVAVDVVDQVLGDEGFPVAGDGRVRVHAPVVNGVRIGEHDDHFLGGSGGHVFIGAVGRPHGVHVSLGVGEVAVQEVQDRVALVAILRVAGRKVDEDVAIRRVAFEVPFEGFPVDDDFLHGSRPLGRLLLAESLWSRLFGCAGCSAFCENIKPAAPARSASVNVKLKRKENRVDFISSTLWPQVSLHPGDRLVLNGITSCDDRSRRSKLTRA